MSYEEYFRTAFEKQRGFSDYTRRLGIIASGRVFESHHQLQNGLSKGRPFCFFRIRVAARFIIYPTGNVAAGRVFESHHQLQEKPIFGWAFFVRIFAYGELLRNLPYG